MNDFTNEASGNGSTSMSSRRVIPPTGSFVCSVLKTRWPVTAARIRDVSFSISRIAPLRAHRFRSHALPTGSLYTGKSNAMVGRDSTREGAAFHPRFFSLLDFQRGLSSRLAFQRGLSSRLAFQRGLFSRLAFQRGL